MKKQENKNRRNFLLCMGGLLVLIVFAFFNKGHISGISLKDLLFLSVLTVLNGYVSDGIDNAAHVGGLIAGLLVGIITILIHKAVVKDKPM